LPVWQDKGRENPKVQRSSVAAEPAPGSFRMVLFRNRGLFLREKNPQNSGNILVPDEYRGAQSRIAGRLESW
jgi:hypothetical protein